MTEPPNTPTLYHFTLLRHGQSVGNAEGYIQGQAEFPLTEVGEKQAQALAARWQEEAVTFDRIISSPLARARQTAEIIAAALHLPLHFDPVWMEFNNGVLAGLSVAEAQERHPRPAFIPLYQPIGKTGESRWEVYLRAGRAVQSLLNQPPGRYLVVSHGGLLNMVMYVVLGMVPQANYHGARFRFLNTAFASLVYNPAAHDWLLEGLNDHAHWPEIEIIDE